MNTDTKTVLLAPVRQHREVYHLPRDDATRPRCNGDGTDWRAVPRGHPAVADKRLCKTCAGAVEQPDEHRPSLRTLIERGEVAHDE